MRLSLRSGLLPLLLLAAACSGGDKPAADTPTQAVSADEPARAGRLELEKLKLPPGFRISVWADNVPNARSMARGAKGTLFVGTRSEGSVYAVVDSDNDGKADRTFVILRNLNMPNGVAFRDGALYVAEVNKVWRLDDIENRLANPPKPVLVSDKFPSDTHHGWKYIAFGPDGKLYVPVGAPCNICDNRATKPIYASITRMNPDGSGQEIFAHGVRNTVGFTWHPTTNEMWFTDNGRDMMGDNLPACELNHAPKPGMDFGYPYIHQGDIPDPEFGKGKSPKNYVPPVEKMGPHVAPLGLKFTTGSMFPAKYKDCVFVAEHGSWNRSTPIGYRVSVVRLSPEGKSLGKEVFAEGWLQGRGAWGRPVDLLFLPDGSMLLSDDAAGVIYRITYAGA